MVVQQIRQLHGAAAAVFREQNDTAMQLWQPALAAVEVMGPCGNCSEILRDV